jgi:nucleotide-binding universal stress UspA family protein
MSAPDGPVVVAFDGSAAARQALTAAARLISPRRVVVLTVWEPALAYAAVAGGSPDVSMPQALDPAAALGLDDVLRQNAERVASEGAELARSVGLDAEPLAVPDRGGIARTILGVAEERQAEAVVVGSRGLTGLRARLEGSTSSAVLKHAACPVLVVHEADEKPDGER